MANNISDRGFAHMKKDDPERQEKIARKGGKSQGKDNNPGNFATRNKAEVKRIAKEGGES
jgi:general stress protein YciG